MVSTAPSDARWRSHASVLAVGTFAVGTDAFVVAGPAPVDRRVAAGEGWEAGQLVTVFALAYAIFAPLVGALAAGRPQRTVAVAALLLFSVGMRSRPSRRPTRPSS
jgi:DHA1 family inner membrane transport protein